MFEIGMAGLAAFLGTVIGIVVNRRFKERTTRVVWAVVDLLWVLGLIYAVGDRMGEFDRRFDHDDAVTRSQVLSRERESLQLSAFLAERKACLYLSGAIAPSQMMPLCNALAETTFEASRQSFSAMTARRLAGKLTTADSNNQVRDLRRGLDDYAQRSSKVVPDSATPYDEGIDQHQRYRKSLWLVSILFSLRVGRSAADIQRAWDARRQPRSIEARA